jgi:hypothetical protein
MMGDTNPKRRVEEVRADIGTNCIKRKKPILSIEQYII